MINLKQTFLSLLKTQKPCYVIREVKHDENDPLSHDLSSPLNSKLFATPIWPQNKILKLQNLILNHPNLFLIAQFNLSQVHIPGFPHEGILQFYSFNGEMNIFEKEILQDNLEDYSPQHALIYHKQSDIDNGFFFDENTSNIDYLQLLNSIKENRKEYINPVEIFFSQHEDVPSVESFLNGDVPEHLRNILIQDDFNILQIYSSEGILDMAEHTHTIDKFINFANSLDSHYSKVDGYPKFLTYDPRNDRTDKTQMILQLNLENFIEINENHSIFLFVNPFDIPVLLNTDNPINSFAQSQSNDLA